MPFPWPFDQKSADAASGVVQGDQQLNTTISGVGGRVAVTYDGPFYAYIHDILDDNVYRLTLIFASRTIADDWWRAVSTSNIALLQAVQRVTPQFYTHDISIWNAYTFFTDTRVATVAAEFRGKLFLVLENDRAGRGITIVPAQTIVDSTSGDWFAIRSKANASHYWYYDEALGRITVSDTKRSTFKISAVDMHDGAIMIGNDDITLVVQHHGFVVRTAPDGQLKPPPSSPGVIDGGAEEKAAQSPAVLGVTIVQAEASKFKFRDLDNGRFVPKPTDPSSSPLLWNMPQGVASAGWELAL